MEVILSALPSTLSVTAPSAATPIAGGGGGSVPAILASLPPGSLLSGFVLNRDSSGAPILRTEKGDFKLQTSFFLKIGSDVEVRVSGTGQHVRATLVTVDGLPPEAAEARPAHAQDADVVVQGEAQAKTQQNTQTQARAGAQVPMQPAVSELPRPAQPGIVKGTLVSPAPAGSAEIPIPRAGAALTLRLLNIAYPQSPSAPSQTPTPATQTAPAASPEATPASASAFAAYTRAGATPPTAENLAPADTLKIITLPDGTRALQAQVLSTDTTGTPLLRTPLGTIELPGHHALPPGATLTLSLLSVPSASAAPPGAAFTNPAELARGWATLQSLLSTLQATLPETAQALAATLSPVAVPQAAVLANAPQAPVAQNIGSGIFFFLAALGTGDLKSILGERASRALEEDENAAPLLARAKTEFAQMRELWYNAPPGTWQALFVPFMMEGEVRPLRLFAKRERDPQQSPARAATDGDNTRFVVEMDLSRLGALQMDGFVRRREGRVQFDLVIRSHAALSDEVKNNILSIYNSTGEATGYKGMLLFQQTPEFPVQPMEEMMAHAHLGVTA